MQIDYITEKQGDKIINLLEKILKELESATSELRGVNHDQEEANKQLFRIRVAVENRH